MTLLGLGTYRSRDAAASARLAAAAACPLIDTAPVYGNGAHEPSIAPVLADYPTVQVATKVGHMSRFQAEQAHRAGALDVAEARALHSMAPGYVRHQIESSRAATGRAVLDLVYLHNPERHTPRHDVRHRLRDGFVALEQARAEGLVAGYGVATWSGFSHAHFTVQQILALAQEAAGGPETGLAAIQLPVSMVEISPLHQALAGTGPVAHAREAGLQVWGSAPLHGGDLLPHLTQELADAVEPGWTRAQAALRFAASTPGITGVLVSASSREHWEQAHAAVTCPPLTDAHLKDLCELLSQP